MSTYPSYAYKRNLEPVDSEIRAGAWRISPLIDQVSEKKFLFFHLKSRAHSDLLPSVFAFRSQAAAILAPAACAPALQVAVEGDRVEFLSEYFDVLTPDSIGGEELPSLFETLLRTFAIFDRHHYQCGDLFVEAIGRRPGGQFFLLPNAYMIPFFYDVASLTTPVGLRRDLGPNRNGPLERPYSDDGSRLVHTILIQKLITQLLASYTSDHETQGDDPGEFRQRLLRVSDAISGREIASVADAYQEIFGQRLTGARKSATSAALDSARDPCVDRDVDKVLDHATAEGSIVVIRGDSHTHNSSILRKSAAVLDRSEAFCVRWLDEWDLFTNSWRRATHKGKKSARRVWMIDDINEKAFVFSDLSIAMLDSSFPKGSMVMSTQSTGALEEGNEFLKQLRSQRGQRYHEIATDQQSDATEAERLASYLRSAISELKRESMPTQATLPHELVNVFLAGLEIHERQLLEFMAVARFAMPLDLVLSVFSESLETVCSAVINLVRLDCLKLTYRRVSPKKVVAMFLRIESAALRRLVYDSIEERRRKRLHRTVALVADQQETFPKYLLLFHCLESNEREFAAKHTVAYLKETRSEKRHPYLVSLCVDLAKKKQLEVMPFADQILANHELSLDLLRRGRGEDAENLLQRSLILIEDAEDEQRLKNAPRLSATFRLLADRWEARGEFKRSLDLLEMAKEDLQSALPIPDQAQLLNDVGWLQYRLGDYAKSMESCRLSLNTLNANQYPLIVSQALNLMGVVHFNTSRYDEAISYYEQSAYLRERAGDESALAASLNNLALAYQSKGELERAFDYHHKSLKLKKRQKNKAGIAAGFLNLAFLHLESGNYREAEDKCRESLSICEELGNAQLVADNYVTLGDISLENGDFEKAEHHYQESRRISHQQEVINAEMGALRRLSSLCIRQERFEEARGYADHAFALVQQIGSKYEHAQIEVILGDLELEQSRHREALDHYEKASSRFTALSKYRLAATVLSKIGLIHAKTGNDFEARHYFDRAQEFVRADIGRELPEDFVALQQTLRAHPARSLVAGAESQKLLTAFYDLSALTDYAMDRHEFLRKIMEVTKRFVDPIDSRLALKISGERFVLFDTVGERTPLPTSGMNTLFTRTLLLGGLMDSCSPDISDVLPDLKLAMGNAFACIPLKAMSDDLGCLLFCLAEDRLPLSKEDVNFFTWLGRQIAGNLKLMLHLNEDFLREETPESDHAHTEAQTQNGFRYENLIGKSEAMKKIFRTIEKVRDTDTGILILGESGTGKSALASVIHNNSPRRNRPFQEIHCAQIPHSLLESELFGHERGSFTGAVRRKMGLCEVADGGTLFLDDINVIPVETQTKLLHFLESKSFMRLGGTRRLHADVRIIAASNEDLEGLCRQGRFREDLYYRLNVILITLPPLRERKDDMLAIALQYLKRSCSEKGIPLKTLSPDTIELLQKVPWRGNVRELQNVLERVVVLCEESLITPSELPEDFLREVMGTNPRTHERLDELVEEIVKQGNYSEANPLLPTLEALLAKKMVSHVEGKNRAAGLLGISKPTLYARLRDFDKLQ